MAEKLEILLTLKDQASGPLKGVQGALAGLGNVAGTVLKFGAVAGAAGITALAAGISKSVQEAMASEEAMAQLNAVLKSTGGAAGVSADMATDLASSLQAVTRFSDETILGGESLLLTFTNIGKDVFPQATETALDMSQALGQDVKSSMIQLGKALNDPTQGLTALSRVGVSFTQQQEEQIKKLQESGDLLGAQKIILAELQKEFGGAATAAGDTFAGKLDILGNQFSNILETVGGAFLPMLTELASGIVSTLGRPEVQQAIASFATGLADGVRALAGLDLSGVLGGLQSMIGNVQSAFAGGGGGDFLGGMFAGIQQNLQSFVGWISGELGPALASSFAQIAEAAGPTLTQLGDWINTNVLPALQALGDWLGPILQQGFAMLGSFITGTLLPAFTQFAVWIFSQGIPALGALAAQVGGAINVALATLGQLWQNLNSALQKAGGFLNDVGTALSNIADEIKNTIGPAIQWFIEHIIQPLAQAIAGILVKIHEFLEALREVGVALASLPGGIGIGNTNVPAKAEGGPVYPSTAYLVGERGPELFVPERAGTIVSNDELRRGAFGGDGNGNGLVFNAPVTFVVPNRATWDDLLNDARVRALAMRTT